MNPAAIKKLRQALHLHKLDALLITKEANVSYLSGFKGEGQLLITPVKKILIVDFRFKEQADKFKKAFQVCSRMSFSSLEESVFSLVKQFKLKRVGFEAASLSYALYHKLKKLLGRVSLVPTTQIVEHLRAIKSAHEIKLLRKTAACAVRSYAFARRILTPGIKEVELAREVQYFMRKAGAQDCAFEIIVASGKMSSMPHALVSHKTIKKNEAVLIDLGCRMAGYNSDLTRVVFLGKMRGKIKRIYEIVLRAQQLAIKTVRAGVKISQVDKAARQHIAKEGLGAFFGHALGHGIGREVHEYPSISPNSKGILREGMVFTIEPGIYIPGVGGVRVEDMVLVTKNGCKILTKT